MSSLASPRRRLLLAQKSVRNRSLNRHVFGLLARELVRQIPPEPLRVLEIGAGVGANLSRLKGGCSSVPAIRCKKPPRSGWNMRPAGESFGSKRGTPHRCTSTQGCTASTGGTQRVRMGLRRGALLFIQHRLDILAQIPAE